MAVFMKIYILRDTRYNVVYSLKNQPKFWKHISPPSSGSKNKPNKKPAWSRQQAGPCFKLVSRLDCSSTLKLVAIFSSEMSVNFQRITPIYITEVRTLIKGVFHNWHNSVVLLGRLSYGKCCVLGQNDKNTWILIGIGEESSMGTLGCSPIWEVNTKTGFIKRDLQMGTRINCLSLESSEAAP
jgi:hypothetical protein